MKKLVLAMACVLGLGMLAASCKQGTQDVNLTNQQKSETSTYVGKSTFTATYQTITASTTTPVTYSYTDATGTTVSESSYKFASKVVYTKGYDSAESNIEKSWTYTIAYKTTATGSTTSNEGTVSVTIYKVGDVYYADNANYTLGATTTPAPTKEFVVEFSEGTPDDDTFTIKNLGVIGGIKWTNVKFTRA